MSDFFIADTHLGHANIIKYCKRPFMSDEECRMLKEKIPFKPSSITVNHHDATIVHNINKMVAKSDRLWILGDFCWGDYTVAKHYRDAINCQDVRLIWGNHDHKSVGSLFTRTYDMTLETIRGQEIVMCHYPMRSWDKSHHGSWSLFGHVHGNLEDIPHMPTLDVGVDTHNFMPWSFDEIKQYMDKRLPAYKSERAKWKEKDEGGMAPGTRG